MSAPYPCCQHCWHAYNPGEPFDQHWSPCLRCARPSADPYVNEADANPERRDNGCMIYKGSDAAA